MVEKTITCSGFTKAWPIESVLKKMRIEHVAQASVLSIAMDQFTCTVLLDVVTCFRAWGYWMHEKEMHWKKRTCNAADATDVHCKKKARVCNAADSTDEGSDDASRLKMRVGGGWESAWGECPGKLSSTWHGLICTQSWQHYSLTCTASLGENKL